MPILKYILEDPTTDILHPPIIDNGSKSNRGFSHTQIAPFLVPYNHYEE